MLHGLYFRRIYLAKAAATVSILHFVDIFLYLSCLCIFMRKKNQNLALVWWIMHFYKYKIEFYAFYVMYAALILWYAEGFK